jgi:hypothetical protein
LPVGPIGLECAREGPVLHDVVEGGRRSDAIDQTPGDGGLSAHAFGAGGERIGEVAAHMALVDHPREAPRSWEDGEQRDLGERDGRGAVVDEQDLVAGEGELVATTGGGPVDRGDPGLARVRRRILDAVARLVGELAEVHLVLVGGARQHLDVGAGAEDLVVAAGDQHGLHLGVLEAQALHGVVELDVDAEVVGVRLQRVAVTEPGIGVDGHGQRRHGWCDVEPPVSVAGRIGPDVDDRVAHA